MVKEEQIDFGHITDINKIALLAAVFVTMRAFKQLHLAIRPKLVEVVKTITTSDDTVAASKKFCEKVGKTVVIAKDAPGFIVNRLMTPFINNAVRMLENGVASREDIDTAINLGLNHPMGPLTLVDLIGIDTFIFFADAQYEAFKDPQFCPPTLLRKMATAGWLGRKTKKGFYDYK